MLGHDEITAADLSGIEAAADALERAAEDLVGVTDDYEVRIADLTRERGGTWSGETATAAGARFTATLTELEAARTECRALAGMLRDGHTTLVELRATLLDVTAQAEEAGFTVDSHGYVRDALDRTGIPEIRTARDAWQVRLDAAVHAVGEADFTLRVLLTKAATDTDSREDGIFNGAPWGDSDEMLADHAEEYARRLADGEELSASEWAEFTRTLEINADDPEFARSFLGDLGAGGLLDLTARIAADPDLPRHSHLQDQLRAVLATATDPPPAGTDERAQWGRFRDDFMAGLEEAGLREFSVPTLTDEPVLGYQLLVSLLGEGDHPTYSTRFLSDLADQLITAEDADQGGRPGLWNLTVGGPAADRYLDEDDMTWFAVDPLDSVLGIMSHDPDTAAAYLDPRADPERLDYLLTERAWPHHGSPTLESNRPGLASALESATTGIPTGEPTTTANIRHTASGTRVMDAVLGILDEDVSLVGDSGEYAFMRPNIARMMAAYMGEMQFAVGDEMVALPGEPLLADFSAFENLTDLVSQIGRDPDSYAILTGAQQAYTAVAIDHAINAPSDEGQADTSTRLTRAMAPGAVMAGILAEARADAVYEVGIAEQDEYNGKVDLAEQWAGYVIDEAVGRISERAPLAGPIIEEGVGMISEAIFETLRQDKSEEIIEDAESSFRRSYQAASDALLSAVRRATGSANAEINANAVPLVMQQWFGHRVEWQAEQ
ncbi:DUF6571 family protein [Streptomyces sp. RFCAC02]|uniref:DUF6571 family protein n=1 Tax=Streptomyces sp. RFCAC02 TaxID=2499143 RepID=UPI001020A49F|nr:DUF6571 family protein [Streptomyces sp. RFCAC02]